MKPKSIIAWTYLDYEGYPQSFCFLSFDHACASGYKTNNQKPVKVRITVMPDRKKGKK